MWLSWNSSLQLCGCERPAPAENNLHLRRNVAEDVPAGRSRRSGAHRAEAGAGWDTPSLGAAAHPRLLSAPCGHCRSSLPSERARGATGGLPCCARCLGRDLSQSKQHPQKAALSVLGACFWNVTVKEEGHKMSHSLLCASNIHSLALGKKKIKNHSMGV